MLRDKGRPDHSHEPEFLPSSSCVVLVMACIWMRLKLFIIALLSLLLVTLSLVLEHELCDKPKQVGDLDHLPQGAAISVLVRAISFLMEESSVREQEPRFSLQGENTGKER
jgi:hypothetical protein